jgi:hypothetical protein
MRRITPYLVVLALLGVFSLPALAQQCPCSVWGTSVTPATVDGGDSAAVELGVKIRSDVAGYITGVRFYKSAANTGVHVANLWNSTGTLLASATFVGETGSGWQQVYFSTPVAINPATTYIASYHTTSGHYSFGANFFGTAVDNPPLHALADGTDGPNGVYVYGASTFPTSTYNASNYWVDVIFNTVNAPNVTSFTPTGTSVAAGTSVSATFTSAMDATTITSSTFQLLDPNSVPVSGAVTYNASTQTATLQPSAALAASTAYAASVIGGASGVKDSSENPMASNISWSFTTAVAPPPPPVCPCSLWSLSTVPGTVDGGDGTAGEYGILFRSDVAGTITGIRFYKAAGNTGTHVGNLWSSTGQLLSSANFVNESSSGWQTVSFNAPVFINAGTTYVASYFAPGGHYAYNPGYFNNGYDNTPLHAIPTSTSPNGVYTYSASTTFPTASNNASNYWVDVVFVSSASNPQPAVAATTPASGATGFSIGSSVSATFNEPMNAATLTASTFILTDSSNNVVPANVTYASPTATVSLQPTTELTPFSTYTATVKGTVKDGSGNVLGSDYTWTFTTGGPPAGSGPGGPILVISSASNPYTGYYDEILRSEGMNEFSVEDIAGLTPATMAFFKVAILADMQLTPSQVTLLSNWVSTGGSLIAMHPDKQLASMLGLTSTAGTLSNAYLKVNTNSGPGVGIVGQTIQYHGPADLYTVNGATVLATLYSNSTTTTPYPAVTLSSFGVGQTAAFTFDLARSIILTRQGNPAWVGQDRINLAPVRSSDMFYGNASFDPEPDWNNMANVLIPIADEQQRFLVNLLQQMNFASGPLPRFWYLPSGFKAAVVMTGDDHNQGGTSGRFDNYIADSAPGCSVPDWQCVRGTSYMWYGVPLTDAQAASYVSQGFELAYHTDSNPTTCSNWTYSSLYDNYTDQLATFEATWPSIPPPQTHRMHCISWTDFDSQPLVELAHGMRLDTNYYYFPDNYVQGRTGMFTGSGMPMRFADHNGNTIDVYQVTTQLPDEDTWNWPADINTLLDNANGPLGYYGVFTANMHTDYVASAGSDAIVASAQARGVPIVTSLQMLQWLDGRNTSAFGNLAWTNSTLTFNISVGTGARNLQAMLPVASTSGSLTALKLSGQPVTFSTQTIKGVQYAFFNASAGAYVATYGGSITSYTIGGTISGVGGSGALVTLGGATSGSVTANASGVFSFTGLGNGAYTVTPSKAGYSFNPASKSVTVNAANVSGVNFTSAGAPTAQASPTSLTFAAQTVSTSSAAQAVTLSNTGTAALTVSGITFTGTNPADFSQTNNCGTSLANGSTCTINVTFKPTAAGSRAATLQVADNAAGSPQLVSLTGTGVAAVPVVSFSVTSIAFPVTLDFTTATAKPVTLRNAGPGTLTISSIAITGTNAAEFAISSKTCGVTVVSGGSCVVNVTFKPQAGTARTASLTFTDNGAGNPQNVALSGTGTMVSNSPTTLTYGVQMVGTTSASKAVTLTNAGPGSLAISSITFIGNNPNDFTQTNNCGTSLASGASCTINVKFAPKAMGTRKATLRITDSDLTSPETVTITGTAL